MKKMSKHAKGTIPSGYKDGGMVRPFAGKQTAAEERKEAMAVKSGKVSPKGYAAKEMAEGGHKGGKKALEAKGRALASGKMSASQYAGRK